MPSQRLKGSIQSEFNAEWTQWHRQFRVSQAGGTASERNKNGFERVRIDARVYNPQISYSEFFFAMARVGDRAD
jgi:hypothetical protein